MTNLSMTAEKARAMIPGLIRAGVFEAVTWDLLINGILAHVQLTTGTLIRGADTEFRKVGEDEADFVVSHLPSEHWKRVVVETSMTQSP